MKNPEFTNKLSGSTLLHKPVSLSLGQTQSTGPEAFVLSLNTQRPLPTWDASFLCFPGMVPCKQRPWNYCAWYCAPENKFPEYQETKFGVQTVWRGGGGK